MKKQWKIGDWAAEAEREEEEEKARQAAPSVSSSMEVFPILGEALEVKPKRRTQKQTYSLSELTIGKPVGPGSRTRVMSVSRGLTTDEMMMLPRAPRDRSAEEEQRGDLGGAFRDLRDSNRLEREYYGTVGHARDKQDDAFLHGRERDEPSRADGSSDWTSTKRPVYNGEKQSKLSDREPLPPSRADAVDNWGLAKKSLSMIMGNARSTGRRESVDQPSRADETRDWLSANKPLSPPMPHTGINDAASSHLRADETDNWSTMKVKQAPHLHDRGEDKWGKGSELQAPREPYKRPLVVVPRSHQTSREGGSNTNTEGTDSATIHESKPSPFGSARPREEVLADRGLGLSMSNSGSQFGEQNSRPSSSHHNRNETSEGVQEPPVQTKPRVNLFANLRPREVVLQEKGKDWRKMDFEYEHRGVDRPDTEQEVLLKEEIKRLEKLCNEEACGEQDVDRQNLLEELHIKEKQLEALIRELDDKMRFSQQHMDRPASRSGLSDGGRDYEVPVRPASQSGNRPRSRPGSRSGIFDVKRTYELSERPRSHSGYGRSHAELADRWSRPFQFDGNQENLERMNSWTGSGESGRSFNSLRRQRQRAAAVPTQVGGAPEYFQESGRPDIWTSANDRQGNWRAREHVRW
ncbi:hypothetical protein KP509_20G025600 [Ceratopteris richardii]|uniref:Uncharacterized protein n=1 Tax=Ceratopteris richardii TaxID=49495 RepID=A0A8T2SHR2_CERRI|nr:hypothetical protein KP509_20G025600 [Ceratopteris richardii]KAH7331309.1 hypothetical protein KP509_20G025600 [Ceratopteris richardii]